MAKTDIEGGNTFLSQQHTGSNYSSFNTHFKKRKTACCKVPDFAPFDL